jgi:hypothetical protein
MAALGIAASTVSAGGSVTVSLQGNVVSCIVDGVHLPTMIGDLAQVRSTVGGDCEDTGSTTSTAATVGISCRCIQSRRSRRFRSECKWQS